MAQKLHQLALEIQGRLDSSLEGAMRTTSGQLKELDDRVKNFYEGQKRLSGSESAYIKSAAEARELGKELGNLKKTQADLSKYQDQRKNAADTGKSYLQARREAKTLSETYANDKSAGNKTAMQAAIKQSKELEKSYKKQRDALKATEERLQKSGVDTRKLSDEQKRLSSEIEKTTKSQDEFNRKSERIAQARAHWETLRGSVSKYAQTAWRAAKWTTGIVTALGYGAYRLTKSTAEAGDAAAKLGRKVRVSAEDIQKLQSVASLAGVRDFSSAIVTMTKNTDLAVANRGKAVKAFQELGINAKDISKAGGTKALLAISEQLQNIKDSSKKTRILQGIFGDQWAEIAEFLSQGPEAIKKGMKEAEERGVISNKTAEDSEVFLDNIQRMEEAVKGFKNSIGEGLLPVINEIIEASTKWITENRELASEEVKEWLESLRKKLPDIIDGVKAFGRGISDVSGFLSKAIDLIGGVENAAYGLALYVGGKAFLVPLLKAGAAIAGMAGASSAAGAGGAAAATGAGAGTAAAGGGASTAATIASSAVLAPLAVLGAGLGILAYKGEDIHKGSLERQEKYGTDTHSTLGFSSEALRKSTEPRSEIAAENLQAMTNNAELAAQSVELNGQIQSPNLSANTTSANIIASNVQISGGENAQPNLPNLRSFARGGLVSAPAISQLAERGPEMVVPLGGADIGLGRSRLCEAAHKLGVKVSERHAPMPEMGDNFVNLGAPPPIQSAKKSESAAVPNVVYSPTFHITGAEPEKTARMVDEISRKTFGEMMSEFMSRKERVSYGTT